MNRWCAGVLIVALIVLNGCTRSRPERVACPEEEQGHQLSGPNVDANGNKIRDPLEELFREASADDCFDVIVTLVTAPTDSTIGELRRKVGSFPVRSRWDAALLGFSTNLTRRQIVALAREPVVEQISPNLIASGF